MDISGKFEGFNMVQRHKHRRSKDPFYGLNPQHRKVYNAIQKLGDRCYTSRIKKITRFCNNRLESLLKDLIEKDLIEKVQVKKWAIRKFKIIN